MVGIPPARDTDAEDVSWALQTAETQWKRNERADALIWLRRATQAAADANDDDRALELARSAAELAEALAAEKQELEPPAPVRRPRPPESIPPISVSVDDVDIVLSMPPLSLDDTDVQSLPPSAPPQGSPAMPAIPKAPGLPRQAVASPKAVATTPKRPHEAPANAPRAETEADSPPSGHRFPLPPQFRSQLGSATQIGSMGEQADDDASTLYPAAPAEPAAPPEPPQNEELPRKSVPPRPAPRATATAVRAPASAPGPHGDTPAGRTPGLRPMRPQMPTPIAEVPHIVRLSRENSASAARAMPPITEPELVDPPTPTPPPTETSEAPQERATPTPPSGSPAAPQTVTALPNLDPESVEPGQSEDEDEPTEVGQKAAILGPSPTLVGEEDEGETQSRKLTTAEHAAVVAARDQDPYADREDDSTERRHVTNAPPAPQAPKPEALEPLDVAPIRQEEPKAPVKAPMAGRSGPPRPEPGAKAIPRPGPTTQKARVVPKMAQAEPPRAPPSASPTSPTFTHEGAAPKDPPPLAALAAQAPTSSDPAERNDEQVARERTPAPQRTTDVHETARQEGDDDAPSLESRTHDAASEAHRPRPATKPEEPSTRQVLALAESAAEAVLASTHPSSHPAATEPHTPVHASQRNPESALGAATLDLSEVEAFSDLPEDARETFAKAATISRITAGEEVSGFALAYVMTGEVDVAATLVDATASHLTKGGVLRARGTPTENVPLRLVCTTPEGCVAVWSDDAVTEAFTSCPWVEDDLRAASDYVQTLAGVTMGPLGDRLDAMLRDLVTSRLTVRSLLAGEVLVEAGSVVPGIVVVGVGRLELFDKDAVVRLVRSGEFLFPEQILGAGPAPYGARAGAGGALVMAGDRRTAQELMVTVPPLLEILAGM